MWSGAKALGRETLHTGGMILNDIAERSATDTTIAGYIESKHVIGCGQNLISKLRSRGQKRAHSLIWREVRGSRGGRKDQACPEKNNKMYILS